MKQTVQIRPEQAREIVALNVGVKAAEARLAEAKARRDIGITIALAGLVDDKTMVDSIADDGTVTLTVPDEQKQEG